MRILVIAEKPSAAREIAAALGVTKRGEGFLESDAYVVTWAAGHLVSLKEPHEYDPAWKSWSFHSLPIIPKKYEIKVLGDGEKQFNIIKTFLTSPDVSSVVNACDAGREGQLIFDNIYRLSGSTVPIQRLWTSAALTADAIRREFSRLKPGADFDGLTLAARARAASDWVIGMNASRAVTLSARRHIPGEKAVFSLGRVQTPTLGFIIEREREIRAFDSKSFAVLTAVFRTPQGDEYPGRYEFEDKDGKRTHQIPCFEKSAKIKSGVGDGVVTKVTHEDRSEPPPLLYDLTTLQREANRRFGLSAEKTLTVAQALYERHKCLSYPRSDSRFLTEDVRPQLPAVFSALRRYGMEPAFVAQAQAASGGPLKRLFNNEKVSDHHALIPTETAPRNLSPEEAQVFDLVARRFLAGFAADFRYTQSVIETLSAKEHLFVSRGRVVIARGWQEIESPPKSASSEQEPRLPDVAEGLPVKLVKCTEKRDQSKPPPRHTEATLLAAMENAGAKLTEKEDRALLKDCGGIGTPATRAAIIAKLINVGYVERSKKSLLPTPKAEALFALLIALKQETLTSPLLTSNWERALRCMENGTQKPAEFARMLNTLVVDIVNQARTTRVRLDASLLRPSSREEKPSDDKSRAE